VLQSYMMETDASGEVVTAPFDVENQIVLEDNQRYLFCVTTYNEEIYLGTDGAMTYAGNHDNYLQPLFPIEIGSGSFRPHGFSDGVIFGETVPSIAVSFIDPASVSLQAHEKAIRMNAYPNPASEALVIDFNKNEVDKVELVSIAGQLVASQEVSPNVAQTTFDVSSVENGVYIVKVTLNNDLTHTMRVVVSR
ncbi:MAG TPA: T9SS type A sorting domain-containing protein, partial [Brumimicrobium sp.]|nr:T9SS type A sorting domain-containing protein [Brumimicrobium sp.]